MSEVAAPADGITAGMLLRHAREAAGLHVDTLAANLKVPVRKLEALEEDRYDLLPDATFARALASSVCRTLKVDAQPVLERLPQGAQPSLVPAGRPVINEPFRAPGDGPGPGLLDQVSRPVVVTVAVLLLGALVLVFLPMLQGGYEAVTEFIRKEQVTPPPESAATATVPAAPVTVESVPSGAAATAVEPASAPVTLQAAPAIAQAPVPSAAPATSAVPAASAVAAASAPQAVAAASADARAIVSFRTKGPSWIQVTDAKGNTVLRKLMEPGESASASGALPLSVTVGSVEATEVQVRGKPYNLAPLSKDNVARFEIK